MRVLLLAESVWQKSLCKLSFANCLVFGVCSIEDKRKIEEFMKEDVVMPTESISVKGMKAFARERGVSIKDIIPSKKDTVLIVPDSYVHAQF